MNVQGFQKMTLLDYPGKIACTVFTGGCNLRCPFCHNASLVKHPCGRDSAEEEVFSYLEKRRGILEGVCVTGGEPLLQPDLIPFLSRVKALGYAVKLDTNGSLPDALASVLKAGVVDYVAMDVKSGPEHLTAAIGTAIPAERFLQSMAHLRAAGIPYEFRTTLVKGIHTERDVIAMGEQIRSDEPYYLQGFVDSGDILGEGVESFTPDEMKHFLSLLQKDHVCVHLRGQEE